MPVGMAGTQPAASGYTAMAQSNNSKVSGVIRDANGEPLVGATVRVKGTTIGTTTDVDGKYSIKASKGSTLVVTYIGSKPQEIKVTGSNMDVNLAQGATNLDEVVVTALGIRKDRKSLGYAVDDLNSNELMRNKSTNAINSLSGKIAGVNITQASGAAGSGTQIILRGGTSLAEGRDNQPLFVVDGVIYDNSTSSVGNSSFDGMMNAATTNGNRIMDINPEDIENISVLKGPAASALYGSRAAQGVVLITTKQGKEGRVEINFNTKFMTNWAHKVPETQKQYKHGYYEDKYNADKSYAGTVYNDFAYNSWGEPVNGAQTYNNTDDFFRNGNTTDNSLSISGGTKMSKFYLSGSFYNQSGIIKKTDFTKTTLRFNGEQKYKIFTASLNAAYSQARTTKTLTGAGLWGTQGDERGSSNGALRTLFGWAPDINMAQYQNEDGSRYRYFGDRLQPYEDTENPYWIINKDKLKDDTERFTGNFSLKADITDWWWISYRMGIDSYTTENSTLIAPDGCTKESWLKGHYSENELRYRYLSTNLMSNWGKTFGDWGLNLMLGTSTDNTRSWTNYRMVWNFQVPGLYSFSNTTEGYRKFQNIKSRKRLVGVFGEFRADWRNAIFLTVTGRNDWTSTLPKDNRSYFYPSVSGAISFTELFRESLPDWLSYAKLRASWAKVGKDTAPFETDTYLWPVGEYLGGISATGNSWSRGNSQLKPEMTKSTEVGLELRFLQNRLKFDVAYYHNKTTDEIISPRTPQSTGYIFCSINAGDVINKGLELTLGGTPIQTADFTWESTINAAGNRGRVENLPATLPYLYLTDVQYGNASAASYNNSSFMAIIGSQYKRTDDGKVILDPKTGMPTWDGSTEHCIANREPKFTGGWNNTFTYKNWSLNMLWEFRVGGAVFNGTKYAMTVAGTSKFSADRQSITIDGVIPDGDGYKDASYTFEAGKSYLFNGVEHSGESIIQGYYQTYYNYETMHWIKKVNSLRLRTISLSYQLPQSFLARTKVIKRASVYATATNLLLFTNYDGDPEAAAAGSGIGGSSSVGFDYCGVPATASFAFGVNLTF